MKEHLYIRITRTESLFFIFHNIFSSWKKNNSAIVMQTSQVHILVRYPYSSTKPTLTIDRKSSLMELVLLNKSLARILLLYPGLNEYENFYLA